MLENLDALIAFASIMTVVSLLITVVVQMISATLNLRGMNLANGLVETFRVAGGNKADAALKIGEDEAKRLAGYLLTRTGLSDHSFNLGGSIADPDERQKFAAHADPLGGRLRMALAGAVRPDEIFAALREMARLPDGDKGKELNKQARKLLSALGVSEAALDAAAQTRDEAERLAQAIDRAAETAAANLDEAARAQFGKAIASLKSKADEAVTAARKVTIDAAATIDDAYQRFRFWFESGQSRAQQWFTTQTRCFTVGFAVIAAFAFQLDAVEILRDLLRNPARVKALAGQVAALTEEGERILNDGAQLYADAVKQWIAVQPDAAAKDRLKTAEAVVFSVGDTRESAEQKIAEALGGRVLAAAPTFGDALDRVIGERFKLKNEEFKTLRAALDKAGFELLKEGEGWRWGKSYCDGFGEHVAGMLISAALLTLGAPFWFNALKSLTNLRSALAREIEKEGAQAAKPQSASAPPGPPSP